MSKSILKKAQKFLDNNYYTIKLDKNCLAVLKEENGENPFLLVTNDSKFFDGFILSYCIQFYNVHEAIEIVLSLQEFGPVVVEEQFFINSDGLLLFGQEAEIHNNPLFNVETINKEMH